MKKGFTLVELLTVIVILSLLTIITVNVVMNMVKKGKETINTKQEVLFEKAAQVWFSDNSELLPENGLCTYITLGQLKEDGVLDDELYNITDMDLLDNNIPVKVTNNVSSSGKLNYSYKYNPDSIAGCTNVTENPNYSGSYIAAANGSTYKGIVYFDPTNFTKTCTSIDVENNTSLNSGCMRFYIYDSTVNEYKLILDHNTSGNIAFNAINGSLANDTADWYGNPRLITSTEIANLTGASTKLHWSNNRTLGTNTENQASWFYLDGSGTSYEGWQTQTSNSNDESKYAWLFNNTNGCGNYGCTVENNGTNGYWTSDTASGNNSAWVIDNQGKLSYSEQSTSNGYGIRPVITVPKSVVASATQVVLIPTTATTCKNNMIYNGSEQTLIRTADNIIFANTTGKDSGDYTVTAIIDPESNLIWEDATSEPKNFTCTIKQKAVIPTAICQSKVYDGNNTATCAIELATLVESETVGIDKTCVFSNSSASNNKDITCSDIALTGNAAANYRLTTNVVTATANIERQPVVAASNLQVATNGVVTWDTSSNATSYQISIDGTNYATATSGINYLSTILASTGTRTVYVKALNSDTVNYASQTTPTQKSVNVYTLSVNSSNTSYGTVTPSATPMRVIGGTTYSTSGSTLTVTGNNTTLYTVTSAVIGASGYTTNFNGWSPANGTINADTTVTANFTRNTNSYVLTVNPNGGKYDGSTGNKTYTQNYGTTKSIGNPSENATYSITYNANSQNASYTGSPTTVARPFTSWSLSGTGSFSNGIYTYGAGNGTLTANYNTTSSSFSLPAITKTGYTCKWAEGSTSGTQYTGGTSRTITADKTYYAVCGAHTYTVKYNGNNNTGGSTASSSHTYDTAKALTTNGFTRTGYTFTGWSTSASDTSKVYDTGEYTGSQPSSASTYNDFKQYSIPAPFAAGEVYQLDVDVKGSGTLYNYFYGAANYLQVASWTNSNGQSGSGTDGFNQIPLTSSYTHYTVRFTLSNNGNTGVVKYLLFRAMPGCTATIKNISFKKVSSSSTAYVNGQSVKNLTSTNGATVNLYAIWDANAYTVKYNGNNNTGGSTASSSHTYDTAKALTTNGFTRTGYTFTGWSTSASDTSKVYDTGEYTGSQPSSASTYNDFKQYSIPAPFAAGEVYQLDVDVKGSGTLYNYFYGAANYLQVASWTNSNGQSGSGTDGFNQIPLTSSYTHYTVRFTLSNNGNTGVVKYLLFRAMPGCTATIKNISFKKVSSSSTAYVNGQSVKNLTSTNGATVNLYAIWDANVYTISLNANGGSDGTTSVNIAYNTAQGNYPSITKPTRSGYTFNGFWDTSAASGGTQWYDANGNSLRTFNLTSNATWYARWSANTYYVTYDLNGGSNGPSPNPQSFVFNSGAKLSTTVPTKTGHDFAHWKYSNGSNTFAAGAAIPTGWGSFTAVAQWTIHTNTLTVNPNGGSVTFNGAARTGATSATQNYNTTIAVPNATRGNANKTISSYTVSYNTDGGSAAPGAQTATKTGTYSYAFGGWSNSGTCGSMSGTTYTFPANSGTTCTKTASWTESLASTSGGSVTLASAPTKSGYSFAGWKSSTNNTVYAAGATYTPTANTTMTAQWTPLAPTMNAPTPTGTALTGTGSTKTAGFRVGATVTFTCTGQSGNYPNTLTISGQSAVTNPNNAASISATYTITAPSTSFTISATCTGKVGGSVTVSSVAKPIYRVFQLLYKQNGAASIGSTSSSKQILAANSTSGDGGSQYTLPTISCTSRGRGCGVQGWDLDSVAYARFATGAKITVCTTGTSGCSGTSSSTSKASSGVIQLGADYDARNVYAITYFKLNNPNKSGGSTTSALSTSDSSWLYIWNTATSATFTNKCYNTSKPKAYGKTASGSYTLFCSSATCTASNTSPWNSSSFSGYECR